MVNDIISPLLQITAQDLEQNQIQEFNALKTEAYNFLQEIDKENAVYTNIMKKKSLQSKLEAMYIAMRRSTLRSRTLMTKAHHFEKKVNEFIGRSVHLAYVTEEGQLLIADEANIGKLYMQGTKNMGRLNISQSKAKKFLKNAQEDALTDLRDQLKIVSSHKANIYKIALQRWANSTPSDTLMLDGDKWHDKNVLWWNYSTAKHSYFTKMGKYYKTKGLIAEGYVSAVVEQDNLVNNRDIEASIARLVLAHIDPNSTPALQKGDIVLKGDGQVQLAVKSGSFSSAMLGQYIRLAINIQTIPPLSAKDFQTNLENGTLLNASDLYKKILTAADETITEMLKKEINLTS